MDALPEVVAGRRHNVPERLGIPAAIAVPVRRVRRVVSERHDP